jgi:drug/metabolite transporter (DMT)-like permease
MTSAAPSVTPVRSTFGPAFLALLGGALAMGASPIFVRLADVGPFASAFFRVLLALPVLYAWMRVEETKAAVPDTAPLFSLPVIATGFAFAADLFFWHLSITNTTVANATFFATMAPRWVVVFGWLIYRRRPSRNALAGLGLCLIGGLALVGQSLAFASGHLVGDGLAVVTAVFFGLYFLTVEKARLRHRAARVTFYMSVVAAAVLAVVALWATIGLGQRLLPASALGWLTLFGLAWICHVGGQGLLSIALGSLPVTFSSLVIFLEGVAAAVLGWLILNEPVSLLQAVGGLVIVAGIWIARPRTG